VSSVAEVQTIRRDAASFWGKLDGAPLARTRGVS